MTERADEDRVRRDSAAAKKNRAAVGVRSCLNAVVRIGIRSGKRERCRSVSAIGIDHVEACVGAVRIFTGFTQIDLCRSIERDEDAAAIAAGHVRVLLRCAADVERVVRAARRAIAGVRSAHRVTHCQIRA